MDEEKTLKERVAAKFGELVAGSANSDPEQITQTLFGPKPPKSDELIAYFKSATRRPGRDPIS